MPRHAPGADIFRNFPTKADFVQFGRFDVLMVAAFRDLPPHLGVMDAAPPGELRAELLRYRLLREEV